MQFFTINTNKSISNFGHHISHAIAHVFILLIKKFKYFLNASEKKLLLQETCTNMVPCQCRGQAKEQGAAPETPTIDT